jgi:hypothetical protein
MTTNNVLEEGSDLAPDDDSQSTVEFSVETMLTKDRKDECRNVLQQLNSFGFSQRQKLYLSYLMALELENHHASKYLVDAVKQTRTILAPGKDALEVNKPKLIVGNQKSSKLL